MKFKSHFKKENGFTLIELILASAISLSTIMIGYYVLRNIIEGNKIDEIQFGLNSQVNDALDFIIDEVESGERIIDEESNIRSLNNNCSFPSGSTFIFGIKFTNQALAKSDYIKGGNEFNISQIDCPIVYSLKQSTKQENGPYEYYVMDLNLTKKVNIYHHHLMIFKILLFLKIYLRNIIIKLSAILLEVLKLFVVFLTVSIILISQ